MRFGFPWHWPDGYPRTETAQLKTGIPLEYRPGLVNNFVFLRESFVGLEEAHLKLKQAAEALNVDEDYLVVIDEEGDPIPHAEYTRRLEGRIENLSRRTKSLEKTLTERTKPC